LQRLPNENVEYVQDDGTLAGFVAESQISPKDAWMSSEPVVNPEPAPTDDSQQPGSSEASTETQTTSPEADPATSGTVAGGELSDPAITEILPNPASPQTDAADEYIELYNPNTSSLDLKGYMLETGTATLHDFTFTDSTLLSGQSYTAFYSALTKMAADK
jgi:hypothetical protein